MNPFLRGRASAFVACMLFTSLAGAKPLSDLVSPEKRRSAVELAQHLTRPPQPIPVPANFANPFNPVDFDQPDPEELKAAAAAAGRNAGPSPSGGGSQAVRPPGEHEILESLAAKLPTTGTMIFNGEPLLLLSRGRVKVGDKFTVAYNGQDYELELVAIDRTTFTLRYHGEEITRSIKLGKSP
jgi:hypothetical protein